MDEAARLIFDGVVVRRFHTQPMIHSETVGHHQGLVMALLAYAYSQASREFWIYAALHDLAECRTGDAPSFVKQESPSIKELLDDLEDQTFNRANLPLPILCREDKIKMKRLDYVAGMLTCYHEFQLGNRRAADSFHNFLRYYSVFPRPEPGQEGSKLDAIVLYLKDQFLSA